MFIVSAEAGTLLAELKPEKCMGIYMIIYDGIIFSLQRAGGISVLFEEIFNRLALDGIDHKILRYGLQADKRTANLKRRMLERYRDVVSPMCGNVFHSTYYRLPSGIRNNTAVITTVHDYTYERFIGGVKAKVHSWQKNRAINNSDIVICVSESTKQDAMEYSRVSEDKIAVIYNGVSSEYQPLEISPSNNVCFVLFVGARPGYKNFEAAVKAVSPHKDIKLVCVGGGAFIKGELEMLERYLPSRYSHAGFVTNAELNVYYNKALCLIYPSVYEGFGIPILEAMSAGCPVIAVNVSSIPEVAGDAALLVESGSQDELDAAISSLIFSSKREELIVKGLLQAKKFSWDATYTKTLELYEDVLGKKLA